MRRFAVLLIAPVLVGGLLSGCGGSSTEAAEKGLPKVTGAYGDKPKVTIDKTVKAPVKLKSTVLKKGTGPKVAKGDLLVADYLGKVYKSGYVFDNSYDRKAPSAFPIGVGKVVTGWDKTLVGVPVGSRVLMVLPPKEGYGKTGNPQAKIKATDSLVFVVDVIATYGNDATTDAPTPVTILPKGIPTVAGTWGTEPTLTVPKGTTPPTKMTATVLATGKGKPVVKGHVIVVQYVAVDWTGKVVGKTWAGDGVQGVAVGAQGDPPGSNPFDLLVGAPVGSRVLLQLPVQQGGDPAKQSIAVVIDVLAQNGTAKEESKS